MQVGSAVAAVGLAAVALTGKRRRLVRISLAIAALSAGGAAVWDVVWWGIMADE